MMKMIVTKTNNNNNSSSSSETTTTANDTHNNGNSKLIGKRCVIVLILCSLNVLMPGKFLNQYALIAPLSIDDLIISSSSGSNSLGSNTNSSSLTTTKEATTITNNESEEEGSYDDKDYQYQDRSSNSNNNNNNTITPTSTSITTYTTTPNNNKKKKWKKKKKKKVKVEAATVLAEGSDDETKILSVKQRQQQTLLNTIFKDILQNQQQQLKQNATSTTTTTTTIQKEVVGGGVCGTNKCFFQSSSSNHTSNNIGYLITKSKTTTKVCNISLTNAYNIAMKLQQDYPQIDTLYIQNQPPLLFDSQTVSKDKFENDITSLNTNIRMINNVKNKHNYFSTEKAICIQPMYVAPTPNILLGCGELRQTKYNPNITTMIDFIEQHVIPINPKNSNKPISISSSTAAAEAATEEEVQENDSSSLSTVGKASAVSSFLNQLQYSINVLNNMTKQSQYECLLNDTYVQYYLI